MILLICFAFFFSLSKAQMTKEERESLLKKISKPIREENIVVQQLDSLINEKDVSFRYDKDKIKQIMNQYNFPINYNFFEDTNAEINVKNQGNCGSCWSFASTTALSYRFYKQGIAVDLSPQEPISCLNQNCEGNIPISFHLNLVKNGTVKDECIPYTASNGSVEKCSSTCKDGSEKIKYYSKNAYIIEPIYDDQHYYDYIKVIIDQLINYGPVVSSIIAYEDFQYGNFCPDIYSYDGISRNLGFHDIVIVGYGLYNDKYYWLIQNSWGYDWCEKGLSKIEFGQVGIETVSFSEPYIIRNNYTESKEIFVNLANIIEKTNCYINFTLDSYDKELENNFELIFKNNKNNDKIYYYCGIVPLINNSSPICLNNMYSSIVSSGIYELYEYSSLGNESRFIINSNKLKINISTDVFNTILNTHNKKFYISGNGSKILIMSYDCDECVFKYNIYPNSYSNAFEDCQQINFNNLESEQSYYQKKFYLVSCTIREKEIEYFNYSYIDSSNDIKMLYDNSCGIKYYIDAIIYKLDKTKYPLLKIKDFILPNDDYLSQYSEFILTADVEGSISGFTSFDNTFYVFIDIENNNIKKAYELYCKPNNIIIISNYTIRCFFNYNYENKISYNSVTLYPYVHQIDTQPYEVIIPKSIKKINENDEGENDEDENDEDEDIKPIPKSSSSSGLSGGVIAGIVIGVVAFIAAGIFITARACK